MEKGHAESIAVKTSTLDNKLPVLNYSHHQKHIMMVIFISLLQKRITGRNKHLKTFLFFASINNATKIMLCHQ
jgi:hypothetical protein